MVPTGEGKLFTRRLVAGAIDALVMLVSVPVGSLLAGVLVGWFFEFARTATAADVQGMDLVRSAAPVVAIVVLLTYEPSWIARMGRSPGKAAMGLWVVSDSGGPIPLGVAFMRGVLKIFSVLPLGLGIWNAALDSRHKTWHDLFLGTNVSATAPDEAAVPTHSRAISPQFMNPAHPVQRLFARIIDTAILVICALFVLTVARAIALWGTDPRTGGVSDLHATAAVLVYAGLLAGVALYDIAFIARRGQTPGKMAMGVRIVDRRGETPKWGAATLRWAATVGVALIPFIGLFLAGFVFLWVVWDRRGQGLHDKIAGSKAVADEPRIRIVEPREDRAPRVEEG